MKRTRDEWIELAEKRVINILNSYSCCPIRMLEAKISEAGPGNKRPNPLSISTALNRLTSAGRIQVVPKRTERETPFYAPSWVDIKTETFQTTLETRRHLYLVHKGLTERNEYCSDVLEKLLDKALEAKGDTVFLSRFGHQTLPEKRPLDFVVELDGVKFGGEAKNYREWIYPESEEIWSTISKCCEIDAVPVFATRKLAYVCFLLFRRIGMIGYQTHFQFFHPIVEPELQRIKQVDGLGYKDIKCTLESDVNMETFVRNTLPSIGKEFQGRFRSNKEVLIHYSDEKKLGDSKLHPRLRKERFAEAWKVLMGGELPDDVLV